MLQAATSHKKLTDQRGLSPVFLIGGIGLVLGVTALVVFSLGQGKPMTASQSQPQGTQKIVRQRTTQTKPSQQTVELYTSDDFRLRVPPNWQYEVAENSLIRSFVARPKSEQLTLLPMFLIEVTPNVGSKFILRGDDFARLGLQKSETTLGGVTALTYSGTMANPVEKGSSIEAVYYILTVSNTGYVVGYEYDKKKASPADLEALKTFTETFEPL